MLEPIGNLIGDEWVTGCWSIIRCEGKMAGDFVMYIPYSGKDNSYLGVNVNINVVKIPYLVGASEGCFEAGSTDGGYGRRYLDTLDPSNVVT